jgi:hypothetical protein
MYIEQKMYLNGTTSQPNITNSIKEIKLHVWRSYMSLPLGTILRGMTLKGNYL